MPETPLPAHRAALDAFLHWLEAPEGWRELAWCWDACAADRIERGLPDDPRLMVDLMCARLQEEIRGLPPSRLQRHLFAWIRDPEALAHLRSCCASPNPRRSAALVLAHAVSEAREAEGLRPSGPAGSPP